MGSGRPGARRRWTWTRTCGHPGCCERAHYEYDRQRDMLESQRRIEGEWLCSRHSRTFEILSVDNSRRVVEITAGKSERFPDLPGLFWRETGSGFAHGLGWRAWADDFPAGTRVRVTIEVLLPEGHAP